MKQMEEGVQPPHPRGLGQLWRLNKALLPLAGLGLGQDGHHSLSSHRAQNGSDLDRLNQSKTSSKNQDL